jgi:hypothetical protein
MAWSECVGNYRGSIVAAGMKAMSQDLSYIEVFGSGQLYR